MLDQDALIHMFLGVSTSVAKTSTNPLTNKPYPGMAIFDQVFLGSKWSIFVTGAFGPLGSSIGLWIIQWSGTSCNWDSLVFFLVVMFLHSESLTGDPSKNSCDDWPIHMRWMRNLSIRSFYTSCGLEKIALEPHSLGIQIPTDKVFGDVWVWFLGPNTSKI